MLAILIFVSIVYSRLEPTKKSGSSTVITDTRTYEQSWRSPTGSEYAEIGKLIIQNDIRICGEYHIKEITLGEYVIACSPDGTRWQYFVAYTKIGKFYRASDEMVGKLKPPY
jgi:hypothetical protein